MRVSFLDDVIYASHIVRDVLMMSKTSENSKSPDCALVSLMHMPPAPASRVLGHRVGVGTGQSRGPVRGLQRNSPVRVGGEKG